MNKFTFPAFLCIVSIYFSCKSDRGPLPYLGFTEFIDGDTIHHKIPDFHFFNQDGQAITNKSFNDQVYIADFFFIHCPAICPKVRQQMLRIYERYDDDQRVKLVSHTLDPERDTIEALHKYAEKIEVNSAKWHFLTGEKDDIYDMADQYFVPAFEDPDAPGGFDHSGKIILVDTDRHVRGFAEGTDPESVTKFFATIDQLLVEQYAD